MPNEFRAYAAGVVSTNPNGSMRLDVSIIVAPSRGGAIKCAIDEAKRLHPRNEAFHQVTSDPGATLEQIASMFPLPCAPLAADPTERSAS